MLLNRPFINFIHERFIGVTFQVSAVHVLDILSLESSWYPRLCLQQTIYTIL